MARKARDNMVQETAIPDVSDKRDELLEQALAAANEAKQLLAKHQIFKNYNAAVGCEAQVDRLGGRVLADSVMYQRHRKQ